MPSTLFGNISWWLKKKVLQPGSILKLARAPPLHIQRRLALEKSRAILWLIQSARSLAKQHQIMTSVSPPYSSILKPSLCIKGGDPERAHGGSGAPSVWSRLVLHAVAVTHDDPWLCLSTQTQSRSRSVVSWSVHKQPPAYRPKRCFLLL